jgi:hypothetical protein
LLGSAIQIKNAAQAMILSQANHDSATFFLNMGQITRILINFSSYKTTGSDIANFIA